MLPARPVPVLSVVTVPPLEIWTVSAEFKAISPPLPATRVVVDMELPTPGVGDRPETEIVLGPVAVIVTLPALPAPTLCWPVRSTMPLLLRIAAPSVRNKEPP